MAEILTEILIILALMVANGLFSMSEMAVISARRTRLQHAAQKGDRRAQLALELSDSPNRLLSTVQIGITLIGILAGAVGGATIAEQLGLFLERFPLLATSAEMIGVGIVVLAITYLSLIIGELVPKRIALSAPELIACAVARPMKTLSRLATPLVRVLELSTATVFALLKIRPDQSPSITEEEIKILIEEGTQSGVFNEAEKSMVRNVFRLADQRVSTLMVPRLRMTWLDVNSPKPETLDLIISSPHSIFPVGRGSTDEIFGLVKGKDLLVSIDRDDHAAIDWPSLIFIPPRIPETISALDALEYFRTSPIQMGLVVDQHGAVEGIITPGDILNGIAGGQLSTENGGNDEATRQPDGSWILSGSISLHQLRDIIPLGVPPGEERGHFTTLSGLLMSLLGRIPQTGDRIEWKEYSFEVVKMDGRRVDRVRAVRPGGE